jgi:pimeloyl-ACP methyl ester carboxylesterase
LRGISHDSAYVASFMKQVPGPVLAVGHSYGGAVISNAATGLGKVVGLLFVAAFAPDEGERLGEVTAGSRDSVLATAQVALQYPTPDGAGTATEFAIDPAKLHDVFAADLPAQQAAVMAATQRPGLRAGLHRAVRAARLQFLAAQTWPYGYAPPPATGAALTLDVSLQMIRLALRAPMSPRKAGSRAGTATRRPVATAQGDSACCPV